jgi:hypothetical protein
MADHLKAFLSTFRFTAAEPVANYIVLRMLLASLPSGTTYAPVLKPSTTDETSDIESSALARVTEVVKSVHDQAGLSFRRAYNRALNAAAKIEGLAKDHPIYTTIIVLGVIAIQAPYIIALLGFAPEGVVSGRSFLSTVCTKSMC